MTLTSDPKVSKVPDTADGAKNVTWGHWSCLIRRNFQGEPSTFWVLKKLKLLLLLKMHIDHPTASLQVSFYLTWYNSSAMTVHSHGTYSWQLTSSPDLSSQSLHLKQSNYWRVTLNVEKETNTFLSDLTVWQIFSIVRKCQLQICWRRWYNLIQSPTLRI